MFNCSITLFCFKWFIINREDNIIFRHEQEKNGAIEQKCNFRSNAAIRAIRTCHIIEKYQPHKERKMNQSVFYLNGCDKFFVETYCFAEKPMRHIGEGFTRKYRGLVCYYCIEFHKRLSVFSPIPRYIRLITKALTL